MSRSLFMTAAAVIGLSSPACGQTGWFQVPKPPGKYLNLTHRDLAETEQFRKDQPIVGTYYFYWYDIHSKAHFINHDGTDAFVDHPKAEHTKDFSYKEKSWHRRELSDVSAAGLDFVLPVYWGYPEGYDEWSFVGLPPMVEALDELRAEGKRAPKVGLFYDTSTLRHNRRQKHIDLTTEDGMNWFYVTIRDFFSMIPPRHWALLDGRPIISLYAVAFAANYDQRCIDYVREQFRKDFGLDPYIIKESGWAKVEADNVYAWGAALGPNFLGINCVGPGYDHHAVPGRQPLVRDREGGQFYERAWQQLLSMRPARRSNITVVETWNELHEGTDICETKEYGRQYIELTAKYAKLYKEGAQLPRPGKYAKATQVSVTLGEVNQADGLNQVDGADGVTKAAERAGSQCRIAAENKVSPARYMYFQVDDSFLYEAEEPAEVIVEYCDDGCEMFEIHYDSTDPAGSVREGAFKPGGGIRIVGTKTWKTVTFKLPDPRFVNRCNGADFRFFCGDRELAVRKVTVRKLDR